MKNRIVVDIHTHTIVSGHAYGTIRENALAAKEIGLLGLGMAEHAPGIPGTCDSMYFHNIRSIPKELYGVHIYYGVENNVLNDGKLALADKDTARLDYCIAGIHGFCYEDEGAQKNTDNLISCMKNAKVFFVSHPDDSYFPLDYERLIPAARDLGVALEVNNSSIRAHYKMNVVENIRAYLKLCLQYRTNIFLGSDAHDPSRVGRFDEAIALLDEIGFDEDLIVNNDEEKFRRFINYTG